MTPTESAIVSLSPLARVVRCLSCGGTLTSMPVGPSGDDVRFRCDDCAAEYPVVRGTLRMASSCGLAGTEERGMKDRTAESFAYEWKQFGGLREEWRKNFLDYLQPRDPAWFPGKLVLDVGTGSGRHAYQAHLLGASVVAVDLGDAIDVARENLPQDVLTIQADAEHLPLELGVFDLVMSIGVLHHLPNTERALRGIVPYARPGGDVHVYLYWWPPRRWHRWLLRLVNQARRFTVRLPHPILHLLCIPLGIALYGAVVLPYRALRNIPGLGRITSQFPLKTYADYPVGVCINDQFDRFSAPIERRFEADEVAKMLRTAGLEEVSVLPHHGWLASGRRPAG